MLHGFEHTRIETSGATIALSHGGSGPPLLLLHGYPQNHYMWHKIAPQLAERFTVVAADLRGYGDSSKPESGPRHEAYSKRAMAQDQVEAMAALGFERFAVAGHDRGGRVAHRMALDHPDRVTRLAVLDIVPTHTVFARADAKLAMAYYHWFFLAQPYDLPERLIGADPTYYLTRKLAHWGRDQAAFTRNARSEYARCFRNPATIHASCEDYRAGATIDLEHDEADLGIKVLAPLLALWGEDGFVGRNYDVLGTWREKAESVTGRAVPGGHFLPEEAPEETLAAMTAFFGEEEEKP